MAEDMKGQKLYTVAEFAKLQQVNETTVYRWVKSGKVNHERIKGVLHIVAKTPPESQKEHSELAEIVANMQEQLQRKDEQIQNLQDSTQQQNAIIMQLTRQLEQSQKLLEDKRPKRRSLAFWRRRVFGREEE